MQQLAAGSMSALGTLVERHQARVAALAYRFSGRWDVSEDITQEVFLRLHQTARRYRASAALTTWLYRVVVNCCLDHARRRKPRVLDEMTPSAKSEPTSVLILDERRRAIEEAIAELPERQRIALLLHRFENLSHEEIARTTGWSASAVEALIVRAYAALRVRLAEWAGSAGMTAADNRRSTA